MEIVAKIANAKKSKIFLFVLTLGFTQLANTFQFKENQLIFVEFTKKGFDHIQLIGGNSKKKHRTKELNRKEKIKNKNYLSHLLKRKQSTKSF